METIYIVGFHGVGKTMLGKVLASRKNLKFLDTDLAVSEKEGKELKDIINVHGIDYYNDLGKYIIKNSVEQGMIVSVGATLVSDEENRHIIKRSGRVIYLRASADTIYRNLQKYYNSIPLFRGDLTVLSVEKHLSTYRPYYEELQNYAIDIDNKNLDVLLSEILAIYNYINKVKSHIFI